MVCHVAVLATRRNALCAPPPPPLLPITPPCTMQALKFMLADLKLALQWMACHEAAELSAPALPSLGPEGPTGGSGALLRA